MRLLPALVFQKVSFDIAATTPGSSNTAWVEGAQSVPSWSTADVGSKLFLVGVLLAEVVAVTLAIAGATGALQS